MSGSGFYGNESGSGGDNNIPQVPNISTEGLTSPF